VHTELTTIVVNDYDDAIHFVQHILGFDLVDDSPSLTNDGRAKRWVVVRPPGAVTGLLLAKADGPTQASVVCRQVAGRVARRHAATIWRRFFLRVGDFDTALTRMVAAGVEFISAPRDEPYGRVVAVFCDISGNRWDLLGPP